MSGLPEGWAEAALGELAAFVMGQAPPGSASNFDGIGTPFVKAGEFGEVRPIIREWTTMPLKMAEEGDVLICVVGATSGKINLGANCAIGRSVAAIRPKGAIDQFYLHSFMKTQVENMRRGSTGTAQGVISSAMLANVTVPLPPLPEQKRIVAKVDGLTARTARARTDLARIPTLIARYKQRLLALAFSGELTAGWRAEAKLPAPQFMSIDSIAEGLRYGTAQKCYEEPKGIAVLRIPNVASGRISLDDLKYAELESKELAKLVLREGDILIVRSNGSADLVGRPALVTGKAIGLAYAGYLIRVRPDQSLVSPKFLTFMLESPNIRKVIEDGARSTSGVHNVNAKELGALQIPIFHLTEQTEITRRIESAFNWLDRMAADHAAAANLLPKLDAAILARAFRGALVPQDPNDEPATELLARIKGANAYSDAKAASISNRKRPFERKRSEVQMIKSRSDRDVRDKPYLTTILKERHAPVTPNELFSLSGLPLHEFYHQLAQEYDNGWLRDVDGKVGVA